MKPVALVTCRIIKSEHGERFESFSEKLSEFVTSLGYAPVPLSSNSWEPESLDFFLNLMGPTLIVLSGGEDIGVNTKRDALEKKLLVYATENPSVRVFGICRGMQIMASSLGGTLRRIEGHVGNRHEIWEGNKLVGVVNSFHNFVIDELPSAFSPIHHSPDGVLESIIHNYYPWVGWMWHPERMEENSWMIKLLRSQLNL